MWKEEGLRMGKKKEEMQNGKQGNKIKSCVRKRKIERICTCVRKKEEIRENMYVR